METNVPQAGLELDLKLRVPSVTYNELCGCQLVLDTSKTTGARGDVQNFGRCQALAAPVLTQALLYYNAHTGVSK